MRRAEVRAPTPGLQEEDWLRCADSASFLLSAGENGWEALMKDLLKAAPKPVGANSAAARGLKTKMIKLHVCRSLS